jgi:hypothetical protein
MPIARTDGDIMVLTVCEEFNCSASVQLVGGHASAFGRHDSEIVSLAEETFKACSETFI